MSCTWLLVAVAAHGPASVTHSEPVPAEEGAPSTEDDEPPPPEVGGASPSSEAGTAVEVAPPPSGSAGRLDAMEARLGLLAAQNERLRDENAELDTRVEHLEREQTQTKEQVERWAPLSGRIGGYVDVGFFWVNGNGSGIRPDLGHVNFPEYDGVVPDSWVFMGDPLSTQINSRGDPAETGDSRAVLFDAVGSRGKSSFIANALNLDITTGVGDHLVVEGMVDFLPRNRDVSNPDGVSLGDFVNVKLAYVDYIAPTKRISLDLYAGKIDPVIGYEYRIQESPDRISVTPSLLCRYTCGRPVGIKGRAKFLPSRALVFAASVTNGSSFQETFGFSNEIDSNHFKTVAGRLSYRLPVGAGLEVGASGQLGAQDLQSDDGVYQWQYGVDLHLDIRGVDLAAEFITGRVDGAQEPGEARCGLAPCLEFKAAYGLLGYRALNWLMPYARVDWRDALHTSGASFVYVSQLVRFTPGVRFDLGTHVAVKVEYTHDRELGDIPQFNNDVFTTSVVAKL